MLDTALGRWVGGNATYSGKTISDDSMTQISVVWSCIRILTESIGAMPWHIFRVDPKGNMEKADHPLGDVLLTSPNADQTSVEFKEALTLGLCQRGNAYSFRDTGGGGNVSSLIPIRSCDAHPFRKDSGEVWFKVLNRGKWEEYPREKIWHVKGFGQGLEGLSPIANAREAMGLALAAEEFGARFFSQGGRPAGIVKIPTWLKKDQRAIARENLQTLLTGLGNAHKFQLLEGGMDVVPWGNMSLDDMQFILTRKMQIQEICRFYRVPPHMVADLERATFSNIEQMSQEFVTYTLLPYFTRIEASVTKWLFKPGDKNKFVLRFNAEGLLRADAKTRAEVLSSMVNNGMMTRNEARAKENMNAVKDEGMDSYTVQTALTPIDKLGAMADAAIVRGKQPTNAPTDATLAPIKQGDTHMNLSLPKLMEHSISQKIEVPGVEALANAVKKTADQSSLSVSSLIVKVDDLIKRTEETTETLIKLAKADRMAIFDSEGNPIGTRTVVH